MVSLSYRSNNAPGVSTVEQHESEGYNECRAVTGATLSVSRSLPAHAMNNPSRYTDPSGHMAVEDEGSIHACSDLRYCGFRINATHNTSKGKLIMTSGNYQSLENDLEEIQGLLNWSITTPSDITLFQSPGYPLLGGTKGFYRPIYTFKNDKAATIGPTSISVGPLTMGFNGEFRYKEGRNSVSALGIHASALQPWAFKVSVDVNHSEGKSVFTHRFGVEYVARPDNLAYAPAIAFGAMLVYRAMQSGQAPSESELCWGAC